MWTLTKRFSFEASHHLPNHSGKCRRLHGHSWRGEVVVSSNKLHVSGPETGMVMDYARIKRALEPLIDGFLDHQYLNDSLGVPDPTSEVIAQWLYSNLLPVLPGLVAVRIEETRDNWCEYRGE